MKKKVLFIINPRSGRLKKRELLHQIETRLDSTLFDWDICTTKTAGEAIQISRQASVDKDILVAVGGDGSVNHVARGILGSHAVLGIIPTGSGNGLARGLHIPIRIPGAIDILNRLHIKVIDTARVNDLVFVNLAGVGFDAHLAHLCSYGARRGLLAHFKFAASSINDYPANNCTFIYNNQLEHRKIFLVTFSNSGQYGNNAHISPRAQVDDGLLEVCVVKKFPVWATPGLVLRLFCKRIHRSPYYSSFQCRRVKVEMEEHLELHADGEPFPPVSQLEVQINPRSLRVITGEQV